MKSVQYTIHYQHKDRKASVRHDFVKLQVKVHVMLNAEIYDFCFRGCYQWHDANDKSPAVPSYEYRTSEMTKSLVFTELIFGVGVPIGAQYTKLSNILVD